MLITVVCDASPGLCCAGVAFSGVNPYQRWHPVIGLDSNGPVSINFGNKPFKFDVARYAAAAWQRLSTQLGDATVADTYRRVSAHSMTRPQVRRLSHA
jgi:hypothetical protein